MIIGHVGNTAFFARVKPSHVGDTAFLPGQKKKKQKNISPHSEHWVILPSTPYTISNRHTCQKEQCMINML